MRGALVRVCATGMYRSIGHVEFPKFRTGIFVEWKEPKELHIKLQKYNMGHILYSNIVLFIMHNID